MDISAGYFVAAALVLVVVVGVYQIGWDDFKSVIGDKNILKGIVMSIVVIVVIALFGSLAGCTSHGKYFNWASMYAGLEDTKGNSPMCELRSGDQTTSNLGFKGNVYQTTDQRFQWNVKYTHHSCAFEEDGESYDAFGTGIEYRFLERGKW